MMDIVQVTTVPDSLAFFYGHISYLRNRGLRLHAVSSPGLLADQFSARAQVPVYTIEMERSLSLWRDFVAFFKLFRFFRGLKPDIVHSHTPKAGLLGTLAARSAGVPVVFLSVFGLPQMTRSGAMRIILNMTTRLACAGAHRVWCDSKSMREYLAKKRLCPLSKIFVLGNGSVSGVDALDAFSPFKNGETTRTQIRAEYDIPSPALVLGYVGRVVGDKGIHELVSAWRELRKEYSNIHLLVVGKKEENDPLQASDVQLLRMDPRVHMAGYQADVVPYYAAMDIFVLPSYREGFGISNIEAAAMGLPVVSTRIPGCEDSVQEGLTGILVPSRNARALASALRQYIENPELRERHGRAGRARVLRDFAPHTLYAGLFNEYLKAKSCQK